MHWIYLALAIAAEILATSALKLAHGFTKPLPSFVSILGYSLAFYLLSLSLRTIPVGIAYAIWAGVGIVVIALIGWRFFEQPLDGPALLGIGLIVAGVVVLNLFSRAAQH